MAIHRILLLFCFMCFNLVARAQGKEYVDSLDKIPYVYTINHMAECKELFTKGVRIAKEINYTRGEALMHKKLALMSSLTGEFKLSVVNYQKAAKLFEKVNDYAEVAVVTAEIGLVMNKTAPSENKPYFHQAIAIGEKYKIGNALAGIYDNYGQVIYNTKPDSAMYFYQKALALKYKFKDTIGIPYSLNKIAEAYSFRKDFKKSFAYLDVSDRYRLAEKSDYGMADNYLYRAEFYLRMPKVDSAIYFTQKSLVLAEKTNYFEVIRLCYKYLADLYKEKNKFDKAFYYLDKSKKLEDSLTGEATRKDLSTLHVQFETEKKNRVIAQEKKKNLQNELKAESRKRWMILGFSLALVAFLILFVVFRLQKQRQRSQQRELELNAALEKTTLEKNFSEEKVRISRELHDNIGSHLTFMISSMDNLSYIENQDAKLTKIKELSSFGRATMKDLRDTIWAMNHDDGNLEQLISRVANLRSVLPESLSVVIEQKADVSNAMNGLQLLNTYRIIQEFTQNTIKYANADALKIAFSDEQKQLVISLADNGDGFDISSAAFGNGILNMKRRCEDVFGTFEIKSSGEGTEVICRIPWI